MGDKRLDDEVIHFALKSTCKSKNQTYGLDRLKVPMALALKKIEKKKCSGTIS